MNEGNIVLVGTVGGVLAGVVTLRDETHISWLYVDKLYQRRGIGRRLVADAVAQVMVRTPGATVITLYSSPIAVPIYYRMGFEAVGPETTKDGMRMTPMRASIESLM
jgi:ribosomal protein S18 acetylase RimI-like enzyme